MPPPHSLSPVLSPAIVRYSSYRRESSSDYSDYTEEEFSSDEEEQEDPKDYRPGGWGREGWGEVGGVASREDLVRGGCCKLLSVSVCQCSTHSKQHACCICFVYPWAPFTTNVRSTSVFSVS